MIVLGCIMLYYVDKFVFFFFFQAEDGIRDYKVTGVQTCALPICRKTRAGSRLPGERRFGSSSALRRAFGPPRALCLNIGRGACQAQSRRDRGPEIGRASCRERV